MSQKKKLFLIVTAIIVCCKVFNIASAEDFITFNIPNTTSTYHVPDYLYFITDEQTQERERLVSEVDRYISKNCPKSPMSADNIVDLCLEYDYDIPLLLSQGTIETALGTPGLNSRNSVFGVMNKKKYAHPDHAVEDYIQLMLKRYIVNRSVDTALKHGLNVEGSKYKYCAEPGYAYKVSKLRQQIIKEYDLERKL